MELHAREMHWRSVFKDSAVGIVVVDRNGFSVIANRASSTGGELQALTASR
jgi:hypothetical protein